MCPAGKQRPGYRRPGKNDRRQVRQPFAVEKLPPQKRDAVLNLLRDARSAKCACEGRKPHFHPFAELPAVIEKTLGLKYSLGAVYRMFTVLIQQANEESQKEREMDQAWAAAITGTPYEKLPELVREELSRCVFRMRHAKRGSAAYRKALESLGWLVSELRKSEVAAEKVKLEERKQKLSEKKFEDLKSKAEKATNEAAEKIGKGKEVTLADINRIRERFGLPPADPGATAGH